MAIYADGQGRLFLLTFRSSTVIDEKIIGGLLTVDDSKLDSLSKAMRLAVALGFISLAVLISCFIMGWPEDDYLKAAIGLIAFSPFLLILGNLLYLTSAPKLVSIRDTPLTMAYEDSSSSFHLASALSSLCMILLFLRIGLSADTLTGEDLVLLFLVVAFWTSYLIVNLRNLLRLKRFL